MGYGKSTDGAAAAPAAAAASQPYNAAENEPEEEFSFMKNIDMSEPLESTFKNSGPSEFEKENGTN